MLDLVFIGLVAAVSAEPAIGDFGQHIHTLNSQYQAGKTAVHVLLPDDLPDGTPAEVPADERLPVLFLLPVERLDGDRWGNALREATRHNLPNKYGMIVVYPTFSHLPWYADHPTDTTIRQETYLLKDVLPMLATQYPVAREAEGRLLAGFSKSGWGAFSLLLRHPEIFARAAAWDAPLMKSRPDQFGMGPIFGTQENFAEYQLTRRTEAFGKLSPDHRLIHFGYDNFRSHHEQFEAHLRNQNIPRLYRDGPQRKHHWESGWLPEAVELLMTERKKAE